MKRLCCFLLVCVTTIALTACQSTADNETDTTDKSHSTGTTTVQSSSSSTTVHTATEAGGNEKLVFKEDDHTVVWTIDRGTYVYKHDGKNVISGEIYIDYETSEEAKTVFETPSYMYSWNTDEKVKETVLHGRYIIVRYKESALPYKTYDKLKRVAEAYKKMAK